MTSVTVKTGKPYEVRIGAGLLQEAPAVLRALLPAKRLMVVSDDNVFPLYGEALVKALTEAGFLTSSYVMESGEQSKNLTVYGDLLGRLCEAGLTRDDSVIALSGGVVGDLSGFAAASYMRGIDFYNIPTTVLSQVDSSIGGKTAVNFGGIKNIVGAFYQPKKVLVDPELLRTLSKRQTANGLAEALKMAACFDEELFSLFERGDPYAKLPEIITRSLEIKKMVVEQDEREQGLRKALNFGHTIGHGIESVTGLLHGECVALGMIPMSSDPVRERLLPVS